MTDEREGWIAEAIGTPPERVWSHPLEGQLTHAVCALETESVIAADDAGGLYVFDRDGSLRQMTRGYGRIQDLTVSGDGTRILIAFDDRHIALFDQTLKVIWTRPLYDTVLGVALDPFGRHLAFGLAGGRLHIMTAGRREVAELELMRPIRFIRFAATRPYLVVAAEDGMLGGIGFFGELDWEQRLYATTGDVAINGNASMILLGGFAHGLQRYNARGTNRGTFVVEGSPSRVSVSFSGKQIATGTLEGQLYRLDQSGELRWASAVGERIAALQLNATGDAMAVGLAGGVVWLDWRRSSQATDDLP